MLRNQASDVWTKADMTNPASCWPWKASITAKGYGKFHLGGDLITIDREWTENGIIRGDCTTVGEVIAAWTRRDSA